MCITGESSPTALGVMAPKAPNDAKKGREKGEEKGKGKSKGKDEEEEELWALEELFDQAREQLQD